MAVYSIYVEKKPSYAIEAGEVFADLRSALQLKTLIGVRLIHRYFVEGISQEVFEASINGIFSEPQVDFAYRQLPPSDGSVLIAVEYLPGQFDQRADSCAQCISLIGDGQRPPVQTARLYLLEGGLTQEEIAQVRRYLINPVECREASLTVPDTLEVHYPLPDTVETLDGLIAVDDDALAGLLQDLSLAMDLDDLKFLRDYFRQEERRDPTITEVRMIDTYWSDHCRHTTFLTRIEDTEIESDYIQNSFNRYLELRKLVYGKESDRPVTLMDLATIGAKELRRQGLLNRLDISDEINACSVSIRVRVGDDDEDWLLMFKNETHNHPTEIEPFGGAATCLGGAIRDPLSGRSYVYQAMRVTGAADPLQSVSETRPGKLPQRKIVQTAAAGYSSYGNQIGLATGHVHEIYHPGYLAKRMEIGAVVGAVPQRNLKRETPSPGDVIILLGGRTGRDGCGGATGSSKSHTIESLESCGAEVQKGNPPEERKIQRLFRNPEATLLIRRCNDFGAGGVSVAIGELAGGVKINLDAVPRKYDGLDGTELAISESQERMAVVVAAEDADAFIALARQENLEATPVAVVTEKQRLVMEWKGREIVNLSRTFLDSNGAPKQTEIHIPAPQIKPVDATPINQEQLCALMASLPFCAQTGMIERFDSTVGAGTILLPLGGRYQLTPTQAMAAKLPVPGGNTDTCSVMAWGFDPAISSQSPYHGAMDAVVHSIARVVAAGGSRRKCWLSFQEYYERPGTDPSRWGKPTAALLGALEAQLELGVAAIGGKDSMSGSFEELDVPPTLVSFAVSVTQTGNIVPNEFQQTGSHVYLASPGRTQDGLLDFDDTRIISDLVEQFIADGHVKSAWAVGAGGTAEAIFLMCVGNRIGFRARQELTSVPLYGSFLLETTEPIEQLEAFLLGETIPEYTLVHCGERIDLNVVERAWRSTLESVFPTETEPAGPAVPYRFEAGARKSPAVRTARPRVLIPVFPGTNCEYDTAAAFEHAGAQSELFVMRNLTPQDVSESVAAFSDAVGRSQIIALPGGFSSGDEPEGSAKFITAFLRAPQIREAIENLLNNRDGLMCGICNGFQALVKLGLVPFGEYRTMTENSPTLTFNSIGRLQSRMVRTAVCSNLSPWLARIQPGEVFCVPVANGEGRFVADESLVQQLAANGQIATQYVDFDGNPGMETCHNPSGSMFAVEGITSPDGRIFGKMAHVERYNPGLYRNNPDAGYLDIFSGAVEYYR